MFVFYSMQTLGADSQIPYFYGQSGGANLVSDIPRQAIPFKQKNEAWKKSVLNSLERIGLMQFQENLRFLDYFRMTDGKLSFMELSELIPQLKSMETALDDFEIPTTIKHYDLLGEILRFLQSQMAQNKDKFHVTQIDELASNERERVQSKMLQDYIRQEWERELHLRLT